MLTGAWNEDATDAPRSLRAAVHTLGRSPLGRLTALDHPSPAARSAPRRRITTHRQVDALALARGLNAAFGWRGSQRNLSY